MMWAGFCTVLNHTCVLFPATFLNDQFHAVGVLEDESVKVTANGSVPLVTLAVKLATGAGIMGASPVPNEYTIPLFAVVAT